MESAFSIIDITNQSQSNTSTTTTNNHHHNIDEEYGYLFNESIRVDKEMLLSELKCPICYDIMNDVVIVMSCLDRFCYACIEHCLRSEHVKNVCPCCRERIPSRRSLRKDVCFDSIIKTLKRNSKLQQISSNNSNTNSNSYINELSTSTTHSIYIYIYPHSDFGLYI